MKLIDADALREYLHVKEECDEDCVYYNKDCGCIDITLRDICEAIDEIPTIDAEPMKRGKWTTERTLEHDGEWYCSVCEYTPVVFEDRQYCPNCGAKMWEVEDE